MSYIVKELDDLKGLIKSISTSTEAPEEVLESLQGMGIESYVTEEGDLMIRYWQVGAESFFPPEQAAIIRTKRPSPENSDKLDWLSKNLQRICAEYVGQWIAIINNEVVASASTLPDLMNQITNYETPFITFIPSEPIVWNFTYAG